MKVVVQRSKNSKVVVDGQVVGEIDKGLVLLVCFEKGDERSVIDRACKKLINLRCFSDDSGKMNLDIKDIEGSILAISQFTLSWDGKKGNRPGFDSSMEPQQAKVFFNIFCNKLREVVKTHTGQFGEDMDVLIHNDGPVTFFLQF
jgi:D-tyrosyl-tRNA(Tyr) deacylase